MHFHLYSTGYILNRRYTRTTPVLSPQAPNKAYPCDTVCLFRDLSPCDAQKRQFHIFSKRRVKKHFLYSPLKMLFTLKSSIFLPLFFEFYPNQWYTQKSINLWTMIIFFLYFIYSRVFVCCFVYKNEFYLFKLVSLCFIKILKSLTQK